jgi:hypothetical protein
MRAFPKDFSLEIPLETQPLSDVHRCWLASWFTRDASFEPIRSASTLTKQPRSKRPKGFALSHKFTVAPLGD